MIEPEFEMNRPFIVSSGSPAYMESNCINGYVGEWIVFQLQIDEDEYAELRIPFEVGMKHGIVAVTNEDQYVPND